MNNDRYAHLPLIMQDIAAVAGIDAAWDMVRAFGGRMVYIPGRIENAEWLIEIVGEDAAEKIINHFTTRQAGARILIPLAKESERRQRLLKALHDGMTADGAAAVSGMHVRSAWRAKKRIKDERQTSFFDGDPVD